MPFFENLTTDQLLITLLLAVTVAVFIWDKWRYDLVALSALFGAVLLGLVQPKEAFTGFASPVVVTVAAVLVLSGAIGRSGAIERVLDFMMKFSERRILQIVILCGICMFLSAFMNNVGALALCLPIAMAVARASNRSPSELLMPLAFASLLGGLITLIGTPPNLLISDIRGRYAGAPYEMFDFAPVGILICVLGLAYLAFAWRLIPTDRRGKTLPENQFAIEDYIAEIKVNEASTIIGSTIRAVENSLQSNFSIIGLIRGDFKEAAPSGRRVVRQDDILVVRSDPQTIKSVVDKTKTELIGNKDEIDIPLTSEGVGIVEAVVRAGSELIGYSPKRLRLRSRFGVNLLALRQTSSHRSIKRLSEVTLQEGDIIILQGEIDAMPETLEQLGCLPLAQRNLQLGLRGSVWVPSIVMAIAVGLTIFEVIPVAIAFLGAVLALGILRVTRLDDMYNSIDGPVLILLGALMPVTEAMERTGMADVLATHLAAFGDGMSGPLLLGTVLVSTMLVTPFLNNAATVLLMGPIAAGLAIKSGFTVDPFLMAVAIGASCDFLTPVGHQSNTLVMGPGGYKFTDYWRLGLPLSIMVVLVGVPALLFVWPLTP